MDITWIKPVSYPYPVSFYYLGMFTKRDDQYMCLPNLNMRSIFVDYFNEIYKIDVSTKYAQCPPGKIFFLYGQN